MNIDIEVMNKRERFESNVRWFPRPDPFLPAVAPMTISRAGAQGAVSAAGNKMADGGRF